MENDARSDPHIQTCRLVGVLGYVDEVITNGFMLFQQSTALWCVKLAHTSLPKKNTV